MCDVDFIDSELRDEFIANFTDYIKVVLLMMLTAKSVDRFKELMASINKHLCESFKKDMQNSDYMFSSNYGVSTQAIIDISCFLTPLIASFLTYGYVNINEEDIHNMYKNFITTCFMQ